MRDLWRRLGDRLLGPISEHNGRFPWARHLPQRKPRFPEPWTAPAPESTPESLRRFPGVRRDAALERQSFERGPLYYFFSLHPENLPLYYRRAWPWVIPTMPGRARMTKRLTDARAEQPTAPGARLDPAVLTKEIEAEARRLGISAVGFAPLDPKYVFGGVADIETGSVIICLLEQDYDDTQKIPAPAGESAAMKAYQGLGERISDLAAFLHAKGVHATPHGGAGPLAVIHFAVEAGLGQLGMNGQLLTPAAGSRCRIMSITTDATLVHGQPVDYGIPAICDACEVCARRCPPGAIPTKRDFHRGVEKHKIKEERCFPTIVQANGCAICMKVCPVQKYGLIPVREHFVETGQILGKGSDELEGFDWVDGKHYGPREHPRTTVQFLNPPGWTPIDPDRPAPPQLKIDSTGIV